MNASTTGLDYRAWLSISSISLVVLFLSITIIYFYFLVWLISLSLALVHCSVMLGSEHFSNQPVPLSSLALATLYLLVSFYQAPNKGVFVVQGVDWILCLFDYLQEYCGLWSHECMQYWSVCGQTFLGVSVSMRGGISGRVLKNNNILRKKTLFLLNTLYY